MECEWVGSMWSLVCGFESIFKIRLVNSGMVRVWVLVVEIVNEHFFKIRLVNFAITIITNTPN